MNSIYSILTLILLLAGSSIVIDGCSIRFSPKPEGTLSLSITDAPAQQVSQVLVTLSHIEIFQDDGSSQRIELDDLEINNLLNLDGDNALRIIRREEVPAGDFESLRIYFSRGNSNQVTERGGGQFPLLLPGQQPGNLREAYLESATDFTVADNQHQHLTIDIDLLRGLHKPDPGYYRLIPALRLIENANAGSIEGEVDPALVTAADCNNDNAADEGRGIGNLVYLYEDHDALTGDIYLDQNARPLSAGNPVTVAAVQQLAGESEYRYTVGFLPAGDYTLAFTCQGLSDQPLAQDSLRFDRSYNLSVTAGSRLEQDIQ